MDYFRDILIRKPNLAFGVLLIMLLIFTVSCEEPKAEVIPFVPETFDLDFDEIKKRGKLVLLTENTSTSYYLYRGQAMGYDYELVKSFCKAHDLELETKVIGDMNQMFEMLNKGEGDMIACNLVITSERLQKVKFTVPLAETKQVLVQRKPDGWKKMKKKHLRDSIIGSALDLVGEVVHVHAYSSFYSRLMNLQEEAGGHIHIVQAPGDIDSEELIRMVADGEIKRTVADQNVAQLNQTYYPNLDIDCEISFPQKIAWAVRPNADSLLHELNSWLVQKSNARRLAYTYDKYFKSSKSQKERVESEFSSFSGNRISIYDDALKTEGEKLGWDWRMIAAMVYQESRFDPNADSWAGAFGLMQLMPVTGARFGIDSTMREERNIEAGVKFLGYLENLWDDKVPDSLERVKFILASYNVGQGHVLDAMKLADELGLEDEVWEDNVEKALALKSNPKYYSMDCVRHGYCRGGDATDYVQKVLTQYQHYLSLSL
jgi:membrane-bound lytic murein transglycosylase F